MTINEIEQLMADVTCLRSMTPVGRLDVIGRVINALIELRDLKTEYKISVGSNPQASLTSLPLDDEPFEYDVYCPDCGQQLSFLRGNTGSCDNPHCKSYREELD